MSIADCRRAFQQGLDGRASCSDAKMSTFEGGKKQRLSFAVRKPNGAEVEVGAVVPSSMDPTTASRAIAEYFMATLNGTPVPEVLPIVVEKPAAHSVEAQSQIVERTVSVGVPTVSEAPVSETFDETVAIVGNELEAVRRALVLIIKKTNDGYAARTAEWQDELAKRTAGIHLATNLEELKTAFAGVEAYFRTAT
jgi:hypothetical protein